VKSGSHREVVVKDPLTGQTTSIAFVGREDECFVKKMGRPGRRVVNFVGRDGRGLVW
jgi:hypothetical protein